LEDNVVYFGTNADTFLPNSADYFPNYETSHSVHCSPYICRSETLVSYKRNGPLEMSTVQQFVSKIVFPSGTRRIVVW